MLGYVRISYHYVVLAIGTHAVVWMLMVAFPMMPISNLKNSRQECKIETSLSPNRERSPFLGSGVLLVIGFSPDSADGGRTTPKNGRYRPMESQGECNLCTGGGSQF